jgi:hypothetical protein
MLKPRRPNNLAKLINSNRSYDKTKSNCRLVNNNYLTENHPFIQFLKLKESAFTDTTFISFLE